MERPDLVPRRRHRHGPVYSAYPQKAPALTPPDATRPSTGFRDRSRPHGPLRAAQHSAGSPVSQTGDRPHHWRTTATPCPPRRKAAPQNQLTPSFDSRLPSRRSAAASSCQRSRPPSTHARHARLPRYASARPTRAGSRLPVAQLPAGQSGAGFEHSSTGPQVLPSDRHRSHHQGESRGADLAAQDGRRPSRCPAARLDHKPGTVHRLGPLLGYLSGVHDARPPATLRQSETMRGIPDGHDEPIPSTGHDPPTKEWDG